MILDLKVKDEVLQTIPIILGTSICINFGLSIGWPSITYPQLLNYDTSPLNITLDETALVAGFLMEGNAVGYLLTHFTFLQLTSANWAVSLSILMQFFGWIFMYFAQNIFWFLASRMLIGIANGFGVKYLKIYLQQNAKEPFLKLLNNFVALGPNLGTIFIIFSSFFVNFPQNSLYFLTFSISTLILFTLTSKNAKIEQKTAGKEDNFLQTIKEKSVQQNFLLLFFLVIIQQFSGSSACLVYNEIIFISFGNFYAKLCSLIYAISSLLSTSLALIYSEKFNYKFNFLISCVANILTLSFLILYYNFKITLMRINENFMWAPLFLLIVYNFFHSFGMALLPSLIVKQSGGRLPDDALNLLNTFTLVMSSLSAVVSTKLFQVVFSYYGMSYAFSVFIFVLLMGLIIASFLNDFGSVKNPSGE